MSAELIIIIVGVLLIAIAVADGLKAGGDSTGLMHVKLRVPLGALGILLVIFGGYSYGTVNLPPGQIEYIEPGERTQVDYPVTSVQVTAPVEGESVKCRILTMGVYPEGHKKDIWVLLMPTDSLYYPQSDYTNTSWKRNGEWQVVTRFGGDEGEPFEVIVYEADSAASRFSAPPSKTGKPQPSIPALKPGKFPRGRMKSTA